MDTICTSQALPHQPPPHLLSGVRCAMVVIAALAPPSLEMTYAPQHPPLPPSITIMARISDGVSRPDSVHAVSPAPIHTLPEQPGKRKLANRSPSAETLSATLTRKHCPPHGLPSSHRERATTGWGQTHDRSTSQAQFRPTFAPINSLS